MNIVEFLVACRKGKGRHAGGRTEEMEDEELLVDEENEGGLAVGRGHRLQ